MFNSPSSKTDLVEIFQSIRASLQPYATMGYTVHENSESSYNLFSEKNRSTEDGQVTEFFFAGVYIDQDHVDVKFNITEFESKQELKHFGPGTSGFSIHQLNDEQLKEIETMISILHTNFKEKEWI